MQKGVVMDIRRRHMVVMTGDGKFMKARPDEHAEVGQEVDFLPAPIYSFSYVKPKKIYSVPLAFIMVLIFLMPFASIFQPGKVYGVVTLDMNPSIELAVDDSYHVIQTYGYNEKGKQLLEWTDSSFKGMTLGAAAQKLIENGYNLGMIENTRAVYLSFPVGFQDQDHWGEDLDQWSASLASEFNFDVYSVYVDSEIVEKAQQASLSPIKQLLLSYINGEAEDVENVTDISVKDLQELLGSSINEAAEVKHFNSVNDELPEADKDESKSGGKQEKVSESDDAAVNPSGKQSHPVKGAHPGQGNAQNNKDKDSVEPNGENGKSNSDNNNEATGSGNKNNNNSNNGNSQNSSGSERKNNQADRGNSSNGNSDRASGKPDHASGGGKPDHANNPSSSNNNRPDHAGKSSGKGNSGRN